MKKEKKFSSVERGQEKCRQVTCVDCQVFLSTGKSEKGHSERKNGPKGREKLRRAHVGNRDRSILSFSILPPFV